MFTKKKVVVGAIALSVAVCALTVLVQNLLATSGILFGGETARQFQKLSQALSAVETYYYRDVDSAALMDGAIAGLMGALDDPYSTYYTAEQYAQYTNYISGEITGIGVVAEYDTSLGMLRIRSVYANSPAEQGGMHVDDCIATVEGANVAGQSSTDVIAQIRGEAGTQVRIGVLRDGEILELTLTRAVVEVPQVTTEMLTDTVGYLRLEAFLGDCAQQTKDGIADLEARGATGVILDLRDNGGGLFNAGIAIADYFLPECTIVSTRDKYGNKETWTSDAACDEIPLVLLVNEGTASASEILAGALQENSRAQLVGTTTYGKGVVQAIRALGDAGIKLTTAEYYTPRDNNINGSGIAPDIEVDLTEEQKNNPSSLTHATDAQLQAALRLFV